MFLFQKKEMKKSVPPPDDRGFFTLFDKRIKYLKTRKKSILMMGDLNSDLLDKTNTNGKSSMKSHRLQNVIKDPTRITEDTKTLIDVLLVSDPDKVDKSGVFDVGIADHRMIYSILKYQRKKVSPVIRMVTDKKKFDTRKFREMIQTVPWHTCNIFDDIDDNVWMVEKLYKDVTNEYIPKRKAKIRSKSLPWMDSKIQKLMNQRYSLLKKAKRTQDVQAREEYKKIRNRVCKELKIAEAKYWKRKLADTDKGGSDFWRIVKELTGTEGSGKKRIGPIKSETGDILINDKQIAECCNKFFANVGENLANKFEENDVEQVQYISRVTPTLSELNLTSKEFTEKLKMLNPRKAAGHGGITTNELRLLANDMGVCLANICRQRYLERRFPSTWKIGKLKPA